MLAYLPIIIIHLSAYLVRTFDTQSFNYSTFGRGIAMNKSCIYRRHLRNVGLSIIRVFRWITFACILNERSQFKTQLPCFILKVSKHLLGGLSWIFALIYSDSFLYIFLNFFILREPHPLSQVIGVFSFHVWQYWQIIVQVAWVLYALIWHSQLFAL